MASQDSAKGVPQPGLWGRSPQPPEAKGVLGQSPQPSGLNPPLLALSVDLRISISIFVCRLVFTENISGGEGIAPFAPLATPLGQTKRDLKSRISEHQEPSNTNVLINRLFVNISYFKNIQSIGLK